jgi:excisionase family DNA binding protein
VGQRESRQLHRHHHHHQRHRHASARRSVGDFRHSSHLSLAGDPPRRPQPWRAPSGGKYVRSQGLFTGRKRKRRESLASTIAHAIIMASFLYSRSLLLIAVELMLERALHRSSSRSDPFGDCFPYLLTVDDTAELLRTSRKAIYTMAHRGDLPGVTRIGRRLLIRRDDLLRWLDESRAPSPKEHRR